MGYTISIQLLIFQPVFVPACTRNSPDYSKESRICWYSYALSSSNFTFTLLQCYLRKRFFLVTRQYLKDSVFFTGEDLLNWVTSVWSYSNFMSHCWPINGMTSKSTHAIFLHFNQWIFIFLSYFWHWYTDFIPLCSPWLPPLMMI